jgi:cell wall assembly regulator SMI1
MVEPVPDELLNIELLTRLERCWQARDLPILRRLKPGLSDAEIDALTEPLGLRLPVEARTWWGWHDGVDMTGAKFEFDREMGAWWPYLSLAEAVAECQRCRRDSEEMERAIAQPEPAWWYPSWFPITVDPPVAILACDCAVPKGEPTPIRHISAPEGQPPPAPSVPSLGALIARWIEAFDRGIWTPKPGGGWTIDEDRWPPEWPRNDIV